VPDSEQSLCETSGGRPVCMSPCSPWRGKWRGHVKGSSLDEVV